MSTVADAEVIWRLVLAVALGGVVGFERERHGRAAGLRTHILVCLGSTLIMLTTFHIFEVFAGRALLDPTRLAAGVITGIGFLGAGTIIRFETSVLGLTTAASIWVVASIGIAIGCGFYLGAIVATTLVLVCLTILGIFERRLLRKAERKR
jgi:putative Mg2+ transporter-C (MgtC) family protein